MSFNSTVASRQRRRRPPVSPHAVGRSRTGTIKPEDVVAVQRRHAKKASYVALALTIISAFYATVEPLAIFTTVGFASLLIFFIPYIIIDRIIYVSAWTLMGASIVLGLSLRGMYIGFEYPDYATLDRLYLLGRDPVEFITPAALLLSFLLVCALTYSFGRTRGQIVRKRSSAGQRIVSTPRLYTFALMALLISVAAIVAYVSLTGGFSALSLSTKRSTISSVQLSETHRTWQSLRVIASIALLAHLFVLNDALVSSKAKRAKMLFATLLFVVACFLPFYSSTRSDILIYLLFSFFIVIRARQRFSWQAFFVVVVVGVLSFQLMTTLRGAREQTISNAASGLSLDTTLLDSIVLNRNGIELGKTGQIVHALPRLLDYEYGRTIAVWLLAPIPREIWNNKPLISPGPVIGTQVYGTRVSGVPPGLVAELYWNFNIFGVFIGAFAFGWLLRRVDNKLDDQSIPLPVYVFGPLQLGHLALGVSLGYGILTVLIRTVIAIAVFKLISVPGRRSI